MGPELMASRPVYLPSLSGANYVRTEYVQFDWAPGLALSQRQKCIAALHEAASQTLGIDSILEVSTRSREETGRALSAFNLMLTESTTGHRVSVECAFQGSKVFADGGPYTDLYAVSSREAKTDPRLKQSGRLVAFEFNQVRWPLEPLTAFYDWLYCQALDENPDLSGHVASCRAFSDIEFNPEKSINCQAYSAAMFASLTRRGLLRGAMTSQAAFVEVAGRAARTLSSSGGGRQGSLF